MERGKKAKKPEEGLELVGDRFTSAGRRKKRHPPLPASMSRKKKKEKRGR